MADARLSGEKKGVVYNAGDNIVADLFRARLSKTNAYDDSNGVYTAQNDGQYTVNVFFTTSSSEETLALVIDGVTQPQSVWDTITSFKGSDVSSMHTRTSHIFDLKKGQRWWLENTVHDTTYYWLIWYHFAIEN